MRIEKREILVNLQNMKAEIDVTDNGKVYIVQGGKVVAYTLPAFGVIELSSQNYKIGKPKYHIVAEN